MRYHRSDRLTAANRREGTVTADRRALTFGIRLPVGHAAVIPQQAHRRRGGNPTALLEQDLGGTMLPGQPAATVDLRIGVAPGEVELLSILAPAPLDRLIHQAIG